jgi:prepilin peptidase CpaA
MHAPVEFAVIAVAALVAGTIDAYRFRIPNWITVPLLAAGVAYHTAVEGWTGLAGSLAGVLFGFATLLLLYLIGAVGAGDVKLMSAVGAWLGVTATAYVFFAAAMCTAAYSIVMLVWRDGLREAVLLVEVQFYQLAAIGRHLAGMKRVETIVRQSDRRRRLVPFGTMVALGVIAVMIWMARS